MQTARRRRGWLPWAGLPVRFFFSSASPVGLSDSLVSARVSNRLPGRSKQLFRSLQFLPQKLGCGNEPRLKLQQPAGKIHAGMDHREHNDRGFPPGADQKMLLDPLKGEVGGQIRFQSQYLQVLLQSIESRRDTIQGLLSRFPSPLLHRVLIDLAEICHCSLGQMDSGLRGPSLSGTQSADFLTSCLKLPRYGTVRPSIAS